MSLVPPDLRKRALDHQFGKPSYLKSLRVATLSILAAGHGKSEKTPSSEENNSPDEAMQ